jgi:hypothetical protein
MMQQQATVSMRAPADSELADDNGTALDILLGTGPDMARGPYAAYEWANCMHDVPSPPPAPPRPRAAMQGITQDASPLIAQPSAPPGPRERRRLAPWSMLA